MKSKELGMLLAGFLVSGSTMALTGDISIERSDSLGGDSSYTYISDFYTATDYEYLRTDYSSKSVSKSIGAAFQDSGSGKWYQPTEITTTALIDYVYQTYQQDQRDVGLYRTGDAVSSSTDEWIDVTVSNADTEFEFRFYASGIAGSKTNARTGFSQLILPAIGVVNDGERSSSLIGGAQGDNTWYLSQSGSFSDGLTVSIDATDGGSIKNAQLSIYANRVAGDLYHNYWEQSVSTSVTNLEVSAPVPEPESWAMMMAGLGLFGFVANRRRSLAS